MDGHLEIESLNYLKPFGLPYEKIRQLRELGLLGDIEPFASVSINSQIPGNIPVFRLNIPGGKITFTRQVGSQTTFVFYCYRLTLAGEELYRLAGAEFGWSYLESVAPFYKTSASTDLDDVSTAPSK